MRMAEAQIVALTDVWKLCQEVLFQEPSSETLFNQYRDVNPVLDREGADRVRYENLKRYLASFVRRPELLMVGEAPGWRGCRFSGVPFTCEAQLVRGALPFGGHQSSNTEEPYKEQTAERFWDVVAPFHARVFAWNCVPFHPHVVGQPLKNRAPSRRERARYSHVLRDLHTLLKPRLVVAVGRQAEQALRSLKIESGYVPHPARGNASRFREEILKILASV